jgi:hypothetical protein
MKTAERFEKNALFLFKECNKMKAGNVTACSLSVCHRHPTETHGVECKMRNILNAKLGKTREVIIIEYFKIP